MSPTDAEFAELTARVATLERAVAFLLAQVNPDYRDTPPTYEYPEVVELKRKGNIIEAIKAYRLRTNTGLAEAKHYVDNLKI